MKPTPLFPMLVLALGVVATGCDSSSDDPAPPGDDPSGAPGDDPGDQPRAPLDVTGTYAVHSTFNLATNMPGTAGSVINEIIAATDDGDDPTRWILDQILAQLPDGTVKSALNLGKELAADYLNRRLLDIAPDFVTTMVQTGRDFGDIAKHFGLNETLTLTGANTAYTGVHTVTGVHFKLGNEESDYAFANYHLPNVVVNNVAITMDATGQLTIAAHDVSLAYGQILRLGLDAVVIPMLDDRAHTLNELLPRLINCQKIGDGLADVLSLDFIAGPVKVACTAGLNAAANAVYRKIQQIDGNALKFGLIGNARARDKNNDRKIDVIQTGAWSGTLSYGASPTPLLPATFIGERM